MIVVAITFLVMLGLCILAVFYPSGMKATGHNSLGMSKEDTSNLKGMLAGLLCFAGSFVASWYICHRIYKAENPYHDPDAGIWIVIVPLGLFFFACCMPFLPKTKTTGGRYSSGGGSSTGNSYSLTNWQSSNSTTDTKPQSNTVASNDNWIFEDINRRNRIEAIDRDIDYYKNIGGHDSNINDLNIERDKLR